MKKSFVLGSVGFLVIIGMLHVRWCNKISKAVGALSDHDPRGGEVLGIVTTPFEGIPQETFLLVKHGNNLELIPYRKKVGYEPEEIPQYVEVKKNFEGKKFCSPLTFKPR